MKRKNILKFVSLLGIGSFVMLAAASCTQRMTSNPQPIPPSNGGDMNDAAQELTAAKTALTTLIDSKTKNTELYVDYAKIQDTLTKAYGAAKAVLDNSSSTIQNVNDAKTTLESAISTAAKAKTDFDTSNGELVTAYNALKEALKNEKTNLDSATGDNYSAIRNNFVSLYEKAKAIVTATLDPVTGKVPEVKSLTEISGAIMTAIMRNEPWKANADNLVNSFIKQALDKKNITGVDQTNQQPGNYSFVGYGVDLNVTQPTTNAGTSGTQGTTTTTGNNLPNWNFARRSVWTNVSNKNQPLSEEISNKLTDVSWVYSLAGDKTKYTLSFRYFGASSTAYLYFPYKLVKSDDSSKIGLQYKLNNADPVEIEFKNATTTSAAAVVVASENTSSSPSITAAGETMTATKMNEAPALDDIKIAKVALSNLNFNLNTIEFSVPTDKVAPMIGNMYLTSSNEEANRNKIYDSIFGNASSQNANQTSVTVDLLKGYSLATSYLTYIREFTDLNNETQSGSTDTKAPTTYLVGFIGAGGSRGDAESVPKTPNTPDLTGDNRIFTIYVNAPQNGEYYISGSYLNGDQTTNSNTPKRYLKFSTTQGTEATNMNSSLQIDVKSLGNWNTLGNFDTQSNKNINMMSNSSGGSQQQNTNKTIHLKKGLNKVVIGGAMSTPTPYIGNLVFTLKTSTDGNSSTASASSARSS